jgi:ATP-dependent Lhr-like helicase
VQLSNSLSLLDSRVRAVVIEEGYTTLTPVQEVAIPKILSGRNVIIVAPTGSGKTEAAIFPILSQMVSRGLLRRISAIYITPLRALNRDIVRRVMRIASKLGIEVAVRHGDTPTSLRRLLSLKPPHILVTTPETFAYILIDQRLREALGNVRWVVVDELHELIESKRGVQVAVNLERLVELAGEFQRIGLSASIGDVGLAKNVLAFGRRVEEVVVHDPRDMDIQVVMRYTSIDPSAKFQLIADLVRKHGTAIVFTNTRDEAELVGRRLSELGLNVRVHHGSLSREEREEVERLLKEGKLDAVVATSSLELGIDIGAVNVVVQVSSSRQALKLVQRVGRARHRPGERALGYVVCDDVLDDVAESLVLARRAKAGLMEKGKAYEKPYDVLIHTLVGMGLEGGYTRERAYEVVRRSYPYSSLTYEEFLKVVDKTVELGYLKISGELLEASERGRIYYVTTTTIVDTAAYDVVDSLSKRKLGTLDEEFVIDLVTDTKLVLGGRLWKVLSVDYERHRVYVEELSAGEALIPSWTGETIPVDYRVAREVCGLYEVIARTGRLHPNYIALADPESVGYIERIVREHVAKGYVTPSDRRLIAEVVNSERPLVVLMSCLGTKGNRALAYLVLYNLYARYGISPAYKVDPYRVVIELPFRLPSEVLLSSILEALSGGNVMELVIEGVRKSRLFEYLLFNVGYRLGLIPRGLEPKVVRAIVSKLHSDDVISSEAIREGLTRYIDVEPLLNLVRRLMSSPSSLVLYERADPSPIALEGLKYLRPFDRVKDGAIPRKMISEIVRRRVQEKVITLVCLSCGYSWKSRVRDLPERIRCQRCGYGLIGVSKVPDDRVVEIARKAIKLGRDYRFGLSEEEVKVFEKLVDTAILVLDFGKRAVEALSAHGVGPEAAKRALQYAGDEFYVKLYELEKQYIKTRQYWD